MKLMLGNGWYQEITLNNEGEEVFRYMKDDKEYSKEEWKKSNKMEAIQDGALELDFHLGGLLCNIKSLKAIATEMSIARVGVDNTDQTDLTAMAMQFRDISHKITLIDDLLHYTLKDVVKNYEECQHIKTGLLLELKENTLESGQEQG